MAFYRVHLHPTESQKSSSEVFTPSSAVCLLACPEGRAVSWGQLLPATGGHEGVGDVEQGGTDGDLEGELCNCRTAEAEGTSGGHGVGPSLMLDEAAQGPVQLSYLQGWRSHQLPVPVFVMETFFLLHIQLKFFWLQLGFSLCAFEKCWTTFSVTCHKAAAHTRKIFPFSPPGWTRPSSLPASPRTSRSPPHHHFVSFSRTHSSTLLALGSPRLDTVSSCGLIRT